MYGCKENESQEISNLSNKADLIYLKDYIGQKNKEQKANNLKIAILDTGISDNHKDILNISKRYNAIEKTNETFDDNGHGTAIASIIYSEVKDISSTSKPLLYDVKVLDEKGTATPETIAHAIEWCIDQEVDIINMSFGLIEDKKIVKDAIKKANDLNIISVAAAGNTYGLGTDYPAAYDGVISITAINEDDKRLPSSAKGKIDFSVLGEDLLSLDEDKEFFRYTGTSFAAAYATGIIAKKLDSGVEKDLIYGELVSSAVFLGEENIYGHGKLTN
ncbi:S8 family serine peptidase [Shouchella miscanthi]|uniref:S8 family serine peptidase n=1 Tax=Shouchella miscanthi TaxID=2598861 RepID=A0ABU6NP78_9BACI|nr:S8 family serine peptidase [Shouchella miscanthi]MED4129766.1 S8 family serine peptidase [Shouchella miscanthi]